VARNESAVTLLCYREYSHLARSFPAPVMSTVVSLKSITKYQLRFGTVHFVVDTTVFAGAVAEQQKRSVTALHSREDVAD